MFVPNTRYRHNLDRLLGLLPVYTCILRSQDDFVISQMLSSCFLGQSLTASWHQVSGVLCSPPSLYWDRTPVSPHMAFPIGSGAVTQALLLTKKVLHQPAISPALILYLYSTCVLIDTKKSRSELHTLVSQHKSTFRKFLTAENSRFLG